MNDIKNFATFCLNQEPLREGVTEIQDNVLTCFGKACWVLSPETEKSSDLMAG